MPHKLAWEKNMINAISTAAEAQSTAKSFYYSTLTYLCGNWDYIDVGKLKKNSDRLLFLFLQICVKPDLKLSSGRSVTSNGIMVYYQFVL